MGIYLSPLQRIVRFILDKLYLESGFFAFDTFLPNDPLPLDTSANVNYNAIVSSIMAADAGHADQGGATADALATIPNEMLTGESLTSGFRSRAVLVDESTDNDAWKAKHKAMHWCPASVFTGKLQLLVQSLYGSKRFGLVYVGDQDGITDKPAITWDGERLNPHLESLDPFTSLLTTSNYDYFLLQTSSGGTMMLTKLKFSASAQPLLDILRNNPTLVPKRKTDAGNYASRIEAYLLAKASLDSEVHNISFTPQPGKALHYGWKFDWAGTHGSIVKHETFLSNNNTEMRNRARLCELVISYTYNSGVYSFSAQETAQETLEWWNSSIGWLVLARPWPQDHKMIDDMWNEFFIYGKTIRFDTAFTSVPIYCYRDDQDLLKIVRISQSLTTSNTTENPPASVTFCGGIEDVEINKRAKNGINGTVTLHDGVSALIGKVESTGTYQKWNLTFLGYYSGTSWSPNYTSPNWWEYSVKCTGELARNYCVSTGEFYAGSSTIGTPTGAWVNTSCAHGGSEERWLAGFQSARYRLDYEESSDPSTNRPQLGISIPWYSCDAVIVFKQQHKNYRWTGKYSTEFWTNGKFVKGRTYSDKCNANFYVNGYGDLTDICNVKATYNVVSNYAKTWSGSPESWESQCKVVGAFAPVAQTTKTTRVYTYFATAGADPYVYNFDRVKYSLTGGVEYVTAYPDYSGNIEFPSSVATGWA